MRKFFKKISAFGLMLGASMMSFAGNLEDEGFKIDGSGDLTFENKGGVDYSGGFWNSITDFIKQWGSGLTWVLAAVAVLAFIIGLYKYVSNPDLSQVIISLITTVIFVLLAVKSRKLLNTTLAGEITPEMIEAGVRATVENISVIIP